MTNAQHRKHFNRIASPGVDGRCVLFLCVLMGLIGNVAKAQEENNNSQTQWKKTTVKVIDPAGQPVEGATVLIRVATPTSNPNAHALITETYFGLIPKTKTGRDGMAEPSYPQFIDKEQTQATGKVGWIVEHPEFLFHSGAPRPLDETQIIQLKRGYRIAATAEFKGQKITEELYGVVGNEWNRWKLTSNGTLLSHCINFENRHCRLVALRKNQPTLFSELLTLDPKGKSRVFLKKVPLKPGVRIEGRLAADVPRPIKNGRVICQIQEVEEGEFRPCWTWLDQTKINEDGTFVLDSVPQGAPLQLIAICDGWVSSNPTKGELAVHYPRQVKDYDPNRLTTYPHLVALNEPTVEDIVPMTKTCEVQVVVSDAEQMPLKNLSVHAAPNQSWYWTGSQNLGTGGSIHQILSRENFISSAKERGFPFSNKTDETGKCLLRAIPMRGTCTIYVTKGRGIVRLAKKRLRLDRETQTLTIQLNETSAEIK